MEAGKAVTGQRSTVVGVFHDYNEAVEAVKELKRAGFTDEQVSLVGKNPHPEGETRATGNKAGTGAATGAAIGAGAAGLVSLGISFGVIPVIGPILAMGPLAAALVSAASGAAWGGVIGGLIGLGIPEHEAKYYEGELQSGRFLVTVKADGRYDQAWEILRRHGAYNHQTAAAGTSACCTTAGATTGERRMASSTTAGTSSGQQTMRLHEEQLHATMQPVETGEVRLRKEVVTEHKTMDVPVTREEVVIERRPASGQASATDLRPGEEVRIPVREEQVHIEKQPVVKEEVSVGKRQVQDTERVGGTVRKEEVRIEQKGDVDVHTKGTAKTDTAKGDKGR